MNALEAKGRRGVGLALLATAMSGCAALSWDARYPLEAGWRGGYVKEIGAGKDFQARLSPACRQSLAPSGADRFATVHVTRLHRHYDHTAPIGRDASLGQGDKVYVNIRDCQGPVIARTAPGM